MWTSDVEIEVQASLYQAMSEFAQGQPEDPISYDQQDGEQSCPPSLPTSERAEVLAEGNDADDKDERHTPPYSRPS